ncbi:uncharacterized protein N7496_009819 [Penicillium cataractarum]|uniref:Uncharacterized protein n=1 Tax=Penicillium cataractarum TaxID=2100454 RepID=A0A9W9V2T3_9EURO|nr:uncharacterized protein N7496_009819 [Penicillium cataractarum]KAJ5364106.1 hypothetical protein N7496_009819 [Penicillium cataractarum]
MECTSQRRQNRLILTYQFYRHHHINIVCDQNLEYLTIPQVQMHDGQFRQNCQFQSLSVLKVMSSSFPLPATFLMHPSAFALDFSVLEHPDILENFDFDKFLDTESQPQHDQPMPRDSGDSNPKRKSKKRKVIAVASAEDSLEPQVNSEFMPEEGKSKKIHLDSNVSMDESSSTVALCATNAGAETQNQVSASTEDKPSTSEDTPTEGLDAWILRWTTLEKTELK